MCGCYTLKKNGYLKSWRTWDKFVMLKWQTERDFKTNVVKIYFQVFVKVNMGVFNSVWGALSYPVVFNSVWREWSYPVFFIRVWEELSYPVVFNSVLRELSYPVVFITFFWPPFLSTDTPTKCLISLHNSPFPIYIYPDIDVYYLQYKNYRHYVPNMKGGGGPRLA